MLQYQANKKSDVIIKFIFLKISIFFIFWLLRILTFIKCLLFTRHLFYSHNNPMRQELLYFTEKGTMVKRARNMLRFTQLAGQSQTGTRNSRTVNPLIVGWVTISSTVNSQIWALFEAVLQILGMVDPCRMTEMLSPECSE